MTGVWEGQYNFFCQGTRSAGESDMKVLALSWGKMFVMMDVVCKINCTEGKMEHNLTAQAIPVDT